MDPDPREKHVLINITKHRSMHEPQKPATTMNTTRVINVIILTLTFSIRGQHRKMMAFEKIATTCCHESWKSLGKEGSRIFLFLENAFLFLILFYNYKISLYILFFLFKDLYI